MSNFEVSFVNKTFLNQMSSFKNKIYSLFTNKFYLFNITESINLRLGIAKYIYLN